MSRDVQEPSVTENGSRKIYAHPAYGQLSASRVEGGRVLYGSDFQHQRYIRIRISPSRLERNLANDWLHAGRPVIEVDVSEAQWATFVSSMNVGQGVPCTIAALQGETVPGIPDPVDRSAQFAGEVRSKLERADKVLRELEEHIQACGVPKSKQADLLNAVRAARNDVGSNVKFVAEQFDEHMERTVEAAKVEVNAYATNLVMRTGLQALADAQGGVAPLELTYAKREDAP